MHDHRLASLLVGVVTLVMCVLASLVIGSQPLAVTTVWSALTGGPASAADVHIVMGLRLPRTVVGIVVGAALGLGGALAQGVTRNPLADPGLLGVNAGASLGVIVAIAGLGITHTGGFTWFALVGALAATLLVGLVGTSRSGSIDPIRLTLAGVAVGAVFVGIVSALRLSNPKTFDAMQIWQAGTLVDRPWDALTPALPFLGAGAVIALAIAGSLNTLALGDDTAAALGTKVTQTRILAVASLTLLAGGATAVAGPISFLGLLVVHIVRYFTGPDQRWIMAECLVWSPVLLLGADVAARLVVWPGEIPVSLVAAFVGAPVLIVLIRRSRMVIE